MVIWMSSSFSTRIELKAVQPMRWMTLHGTVVKFLHENMSQPFTALYASGSDENSNQRRLVRRARPKWKCWPWSGRSAGTGGGFPDSGGERATTTKVKVQAAVVQWSCP